MKKLVAVLALGALLLAASPRPVQAGGTANAALALGAFAVFSHLVAAPLWAATYYPRVYVTQAPVVYSTPAPVVYAAPVYAAPPPTYSAPPAAPAIQREVIYPHGRYVLYGDGVRTAYQWVWVPNPPPPPPPPAASAPPPGGALPPSN